jgi:hypothetical protein
MNLLNIIEDDVFFFGSEAERKAREIRTQQSELGPHRAPSFRDLALIFVCCVPTSVHELNSHSRSIWLSVTRVSSLWRNVAASARWKASSNRLPPH